MVAVPVLSVKATFPPSRVPIELKVTAAPAIGCCWLLMTNAVKHGLDGKAKGTITIGMKRDHDKYVLTVEDQGPGIPPENLETVFARFYTERPKGRAFGGNSGLGLPVLRRPR